MPKFNKDTDELNAAQNNRSRILNPNFLFRVDLPNASVVSVPHFQLNPEEVRKIPLPRLDLLLIVYSVVQKPLLHFQRLVKFLVHSDRRSSESLR